MNIESRSFIAQQTLQAALGLLLGLTLIGTTALPLTAQGAYEDGGGSYSSEYGDVDPTSWERSRDDEGLPLGLRYPVGIMLSTDEEVIYVLNERSANVIKVELSTKKVSEELVLGGKPVAWWYGLQRRQVWVIDQQQNQLIQTQIEADGIRELSRLETSNHPVDVVATASEDLLVVAAQWAQRLDFFEVIESAPQMAGSLDLPFAPGQLALVDDEKFVVVASAFGGKLAIIDLAERRIRAIHELPAHNLRGLTTSPDGESLLVAHQMLNELAHTVRNDVHWGLLMSNELRWISKNTLLKHVDFGRDGYVESSSNGDEVIDLYHGAHTVPVGQTGDGGGDPGEVLVTEQDRVAIVLSGIGEVALGSKQDYRLRRVKVGKHPVALAITADESRLYVANRFEDSISIVDVSKFKEVDQIWLGRIRELTEVELGEQLFFDASLSHDRWMSCHSCHTNGHTNGLLNDNFSDRSFGAPKRVLSLLGKAETLPLAWQGNVSSFEEQVRRSIRDTMQKDSEPTEAEVKQIAAFIQTLPPAPGLDEARNTFDVSLIENGEQLFRSLGCIQCHQAPLYTSEERYDVGVQDELGNRLFNPPSLVGVSQRPKYFHDGRFSDLRDVLDTGKHQLDAELTDEELEELLAFLRSL